MNGSATPLYAIALALGAAALGDEEPAPAPTAAMVEMEVAAVFPLEDAHAGVLVLKQKGAEVVLPIVVGRSEADQIGLRLRREQPTRPRTQDLLEHTIGALGGKVVRVEIRDASEALYRARVFLLQGSRTVELEARPSDSVALALGAGVPIFASRELVDGSGLTPQDVERLRRPGGESQPAEATADQRM